MNLQKLKELEKAGKIRVKVKDNAVKIAGKPIPKKSEEKSWLAYQLELWTIGKPGMYVVGEYQFNKERKFRSDWAVPGLRVLIEYEGLFSEKSGHTTPSGYTSNCNKYNLAAVEGWTVLRYTAKNYKQVINDLNQIYNAKFNNG